MIPSLAGFIGSFLPYVPLYLRYEDALHRKPRRGRWVVMWRDGDVALRGARFTSLSKARRYARFRKGVVMHYHRKDWVLETARNPWAEAAEAYRNVLAYGNWIFEDGPVTWETP